MAKRKKKAKRPSVFGSGEHRPRLRMSGHRFRIGSHSPYKGARKWAINPYLREVSMLGNPRRHRRSHYRHNPMGGGMTGAVMNTFKNPMASVVDGASGALAMYLTIAIPNWILPFPGSDIMSKVLRLVTRVATGGLLTGFFGGKHPAVKTGASIGAIGGSLFDFFGTRIIVGAGDTGQTPLALLAPVTGVTAYSRPLIPSARGITAYSRPMTSAAKGLTGAPDFPARSTTSHRLF